MDKPSGIRAALDEEAFVADCASGRYGLAEVAGRHGISRSLAAKIVQGRRRGDLGARVAEARRRAQRAAERQAIRRHCRVAEDAAATLRRLMDSPNGRVALAAAVHVLKTLNAD